LNLAAARRLADAGLLGIITVCRKSTQRRLPLLFIQFGDDRWGADAAARADEKWDERNAVCARRSAIASNELFHVESVGDGMDESKLLERITFNPQIYAGKPIIRGRRLAVEHILAMLAAGDSADVLLQGYPWLEPDDIQACLVYARRLVGHERIEPLFIDPAA